MLTIDEDKYNNSGGYGGNDDRDDNYTDGEYKPSNKLRCSRCLRKKGIIILFEYRRQCDHLFFPGPVLPEQ